MLVQCRNCGVSYAASIGRCVVCGAEYVPTREELLASATVDAQNKLRSGARRPALREYLSDYGLSDQEIDSVLIQARRRLREESRQQGRHIAASGITLLFAAAGVFIFSGGFLMATGFLALGGIMVGIGTIKSLTGWNITGHDDE